MTMPKPMKKDIPPSLNDSDYHNIIRREEAVAWRVGFQAWLDTRFAAMDALIEAQKEGFHESHNRSEEKAQSANDALQRLLEAHMSSIEALAQERSQAKILAIAELRLNINQAADKAVQAVDQRSMMRHDAAIQASEGVTRKAEQRLESLQKMIEIRSEMNDTAIGKAERANEKRFEAVNEFRQTLSDQAQNFVQRPAVEVQFRQLTDLITSLDSRSREGLDRHRQTVSELGARVSSMEGKVYIGGAGIVIILTLIQLGINLFRVHAG